MLWFDPTTLEASTLIIATPMWFTIKDKKAASNFNINKQNNSNIEITASMYMYNKRQIHYELLQTLCCTMDF